jgi:hypothetical protein
MKKRTYIAPKTIMLELEAVAQVMAGSEQTPDAEAKRHTPITFDDAEGDWQDDNPWETVAKHKNIWE